MHVVRILTRPNVGGPMTQAVPLWHAMRALGAGTLLITGRCQKDEAPFDVASSGIPILTPDSIKANSEGLLLLPELSNHLPWLGDQRIKRQLTELLAVSQPDVVHTHTSKAGWLGRQAAFSARVPVVAHTFHGHVLRDYFGPIRSHLLANLERRLARRTNLLFTISDSCATELSELGIADHKRFHVVPPAVRSWPSVDRAVARQQLGVVDDQFLVACIGRLVPIKRVDHFAEAVQIAPWLFGHVFGDGPDAPRLQRHYRDLRRLTFHGVNHSVRSLLPAFDALVLTSIREGLPLVAVEAFEAKVPVVGYDVPGVCDVLAAGCGVLVPEQQGPKGLVAALQRLRADSILHSQCITNGLAGRARCLPENVASILLATYQAARG